MVTLFQFLLVFNDPDFAHEDTSIVHKYIVFDEFEFHFTLNNKIVNILSIDYLFNLRNILKIPNNWCLWIGKLNCQTAVFLLL